MNSRFHVVLNDVSIISNISKTKKGYFTIEKKKIKLSVVRVLCVGFGELFFFVCSILLVAALKLTQLLLNC